MTAGSRWFSGSVKGLELSLAILTATVKEVGFVLRWNDGTWFWLLGNLRTVQKFCDSLRRTLWGMTTVRLINDSKWGRLHLNGCNVCNQGVVLVLYKLEQCTQTSTVGMDCRSCV